MPHLRRIVAVTADPELSSAAARLGALIGANVDLSAAGDRLLAAWRAADAVIVGADLVRMVLATHPGRRPGVVVITAGPRDDALWRATVQLGAIGLFAVPAEEGDLVEALVDSLEPSSGSSSVVAVAGGCGGAGASTVAAALALTSAKTQPTIVIDGDRHGGGLDVLLGIEQVEGLRWPELADTRGRLQAASFAPRLPQVAGCAVLSWDRGGGAALASESAVAVMAAASRAFEVVVIDLARSPEPAVGVLAGAADRVVVVTTASVRAVAATASLLANLTTRYADIELVVRDAGRGRLTVREVERAVGLPVTATVTSESAVAAAADRGESPLARPRGSLARACTDLLARQIGSAA